MTVRRIEVLRRRIGLDENDESQDSYIAKQAPFNRVKLLCGWYLGDEAWAVEFRNFCESQGLYLTTDKNAAGVIKGD